MIFNVFFYDLNVVYTLVIKTNFMKRIIHVSNFQLHFSKNGYDVVISDKANC